MFPFGFSYMLFPVAYLQWCALVFAFVPLPKIQYPDPPKRENDTEAT